MPKSLRLDRDFKADVPRKLRKLLQDNQLSVAAAAQRLEVTRQMFYQYLSGAKTPSGVVLGKAHEAWGLWFKFRGKEFPGNAFGYPVRRPQDVPLQLKLFGTEVLSNGNIRVKVGSNRSDRPELTIDIKFGVG